MKIKEKGMQLEEGYQPAKKGPKRVQRWENTCKDIQQQIIETGSEDTLLIKDAGAKEKNQFVFSTSYKELRADNPKYKFSIRTTKNKKGFWVMWSRVS